MPGQGLENTPTPEPIEIKKFRARLESGITGLEAKFAASHESFAARPDIVQAFDGIEQIPQTLRRWVDEYISGLSKDPDIVVLVHLGFSKGHLHRILRAELSLTSYPSEDSNWHRIAESVHEAGEFIRLLAISAGYELQSPKLFDSPPEGVGIATDEDPAYRKIPEIRRKVNNLILSQGRSRFVVSVRTFPFSLAREKYNQGTVVIANPSDWLQG